jgi:hypothetical protein
MDLSLSVRLPVRALVTRDIADSTGLVLMKPG